MAFEQLMAEAAVKKDEKKEAKTKVKKEEHVASAHHHGFHAHSGHSKTSD